MKFGGHNKQAEQRVSNFFTKTLNVKALFVLVALASLILVAGANAKFN